MTGARIEKVLVLVTIDTECDHDPLWARSKPLGFRSVTEGISQRLQPAFEAAGGSAHISGDGGGDGGRRFRARVAKHPGPA